MDFGKDIVQNYLLNLLEKCKKSVDKDKSFGYLLTDLSEAFVCLDYELLTAKLSRYGISLPVLRLIYDYLLNRKQGTKILIIIFLDQKYYLVLRKGPVLAPVPFNISLADLFFVVKDINIASYTDDRTPFIVENNTDKVIAFVKLLMFCLTGSKIIILKPPLIIAIN